MLPFPRQRLYFGAKKSQWSVWAEASNNTCVSAVGASGVAQRRQVCVCVLDLGGVLLLWKKRRVETDDCTKHKYSY